MECLVPEELPDGGRDLARRLQAIELHRPLVVAFVGQRAGPVEPITPELISRYPSLQYYAESGCQEIELSFAESYADRIFCYRRDPAFLNMVPDDERRHYLTADDGEAARAGEFDHRLRSSGQFLVDGYSFNWGAREKPIVALRELAQRLLRDLLKAVEERAAADRETRQATSQFPQHRPEITGSAPTARDVALPFHHDVQFTVYRPRCANPEEWTQIVAFAHLGEPPLGSGEQDDPIRQVERRARAVLGDRIENYSSLRQDSSIGLPEEAEVTFVLDLPGFDVRAPRRTFLWINAVHMEEFQVRPSAGVDNCNVRGSLLVYHGAILLAEVRMAIRVDAHAPTLAAPPLSATPYRKIFPSYSHIDTAIVEQFEAYAEAAGDRYLRDVRRLRAGEIWSDRLLEFIDEADMFQLFWSHNAMRSRFVEQEWRYALTLGRPNFVRPTYWENPMPTAPGQPPKELQQLHFHLLGRAIPDPYAEVQEEQVRRPPTLPQPPAQYPGQHSQPVPSWSPPPMSAPPSSYPPPAYGRPSSQYPLQSRGPIWPWVVAAVLILALVALIVALM